MVCLLMLCFTSCLKHDFSEDIERNSKEHAENIFGITFDENQDWSTTSNGQLTIYVNSKSDIISKVQILTSNVTDSVNTIKLLNEADVKNGDVINLTYDAPINHSNLLVAFINEKGHYFYRPFNLGDASVYYDKSTSSTRGEIIGWQPSYPIPSITPVINGTVETYASIRGWLPGEVFYKFDYQTTPNESYDNDFKTIFRTVIFNYFPNGRKYDNLPQIKKSGYYNESVYPITTGDEPIIVSPVYKNDGGYYEVSKGELYYYYFKGNLSVEEIEALPKYRAIDLSEVYGNDENNNVEKKPSYVLAFFGDGIPEIGKQGSYKFDPGYKIGFIYRSNTTSDKSGGREVQIGDKKQGELYGDGRLNYKINSWKNFATSKLGPTEPRMAWMSVNEKMFLCFESGTDKDFNDLIIEVEGGIEPIIIDPDDPEYNDYMFLFEDHNLGDYDMNDVVLKGNRINETTVEWTLMACGARDDLYIYNIDGNVINHNIEVHQLFNQPKGVFINTEKNKTKVDYVTDIVKVDKNFSFLDVTKQPYIVDTTEPATVKIAKVGQDPHAIMISYDFKWPLEKVCIKDAYNVEGHKFNSWASNAINSTDWYKFPIENLVYQY